MKLPRLISGWLARRSVRQTLGYRGEEQAASYLKKLGYVIVGKRMQGRYGEIDLIAVDGKTIVFVEVKTRSDDSKGHPADVIDAAKMGRMTREALRYLKRHGLSEHSARFDLIAIVWPEGNRQPAIEHIQDFFEAELAGHELS